MLWFPGTGPRARAPQPLPGRARWRRVRLGPDARRPHRRLGRRGRARLCADRCGRRDLGDRRVLRTRRMYARAPRRRWIAVAVPSAAWLIWFVVFGEAKARRSSAFAALTTGETIRAAFEGVMNTFEALAFGIPTARDPPRPRVRGAPRMAVAAGPRRIGERARLDRGALGLVARARRTAAAYSSTPRRSVICSWARSSSFSR